MYPPPTMAPCPSCEIYHFPYCSYSSPAYPQNYSACYCSISQQQLDRIEEKLTNLQQAINEIIQTLDEILLDN